MEHLSLENMNRIGSLWIAIFMFGRYIIGHGAFPMMATPRTLTVPTAMPPGTKPSAGIAVAIGCVLICVAVFAIIVCLWKERCNRINRLRGRRSFADTNKLTTHEVGHGNQSSQLGQDNVYLYASIKQQCQNEEENSTDELPYTTSYTVGPDVHARNDEQQPNDTSKVLNDGMAGEEKYRETNSAEAHNPPENGGFVEIYARSPYGGRRFESNTYGQNARAVVVYDKMEDANPTDSHNYATKIDMDSNKLLCDGMAGEEKYRETNSAKAHNPPENGGFVEIYAHSPYGGRRFESNTSGQNARAVVYNEMEDPTDFPKYATKIAMDSNKLLCVPTHAAPALPVRDHERTLPKRTLPKISKDKKTELRNSRATSCGIIVNVSDASEKRPTGDEGDPSFRVECMAVALQLLEETDRENGKDDKINESQEQQQIRASEKTDLDANTLLKDKLETLSNDSSKGESDKEVMSEQILGVGRLAGRPELLRDDSLLSQEFY